MEKKCQAKFGNIRFFLEHKKDNNEAKSESRSHISQFSKIKEATSKRSFLINNEKNHGYKKQLQKAEELRVVRARSGNVELRTQENNKKRWNDTVS